MTKYYFSDFESDADDMNSPGSSDPTRPSEGWSGPQVNNAIRATNSALFNLGTAAAKLPLDDDGNPDPGPNSGRIGSIAFQDTDSFTLTTGVLDVGVRGSFPSLGVVPLWATIDQINAAYPDLRRRGFDVADGRTTTNPYTPFNTITMPDFTGKAIYFSNDAAILASFQFANTATTDSQGAHSHFGATGSTSITAAQAPALVATGSFAANPFGSNTVFTYSYGGAGSGHFHGIASDGAHAHSVDVRQAAIVCLPLLRVW